MTFIQEISFSLTEENKIYRFFREIEIDYSQLYIDSIDYNLKWIHWWQTIDVSRNNFWLRVWTPFFISSGHFSCLQVDGHHFSFFFFSIQYGFLGQIAHRGNSTGWVCDWYIYFCIFLRSSAGLCNFFFQMNRYSLFKIWWWATPSWEFWTLNSFKLKLHFETLEIWY